VCGIAGILSPGIISGKLKGDIINMRSSLQHRGPDDVGLFVEDGIGLAHTRLSIIDLDGGRQPLTNEDRSIYLVANGEIYNYKQLRRDLVSKGHYFRTASDCETIVHLYEQYGKDCVDHLDGMFAFAIWDSKEAKLMLARDRFGIKPLYLARSGDGVAFASELTALLKSGIIEKEINPQALYAYLALSYVPGPMSIFKNAEKVMPSERIIFHNSEIQRDIYWRPSKKTVPLKQIEAIHELSWRLEESVRAHLVSDVPVAAFLSGGVDSSTVVALARKYADIETFCISFPGTGVDEAPIAREVANYLGTRHHDINIEIDPRLLIHKAVNHMDEPFADSSALPTYAVCHAARQVAKVVLSGDGGDEVFGGYTGRYRVASLKATLPDPCGFARFLRKIPPWRNGKWTSTTEMLDLASLPEIERYIFERQITTAQQRISIFGEKMQELYEPMLRQIPARAICNDVFAHPLKKALWMDINSSLPDDMLTKVDRMSMAHGLEVRVPLLDHRLVEYILSLPPSWLVSPLPIEGKIILRKFAGSMLPKKIFNRPKHGFVIPLNDWIRSTFKSMLKRRVESGKAKIYGYLESSAVEELLNKPLNFRSREDLYALLILELWLDRF
jgi:asparagine synthase (glutamine-hydrolysing)